MDRSLLRDTQLNPGEAALSRFSGLHHSVNIQRSVPSVKAGKGSFMLNGKYVQYIDTSGAFCLYSLFISSVFLHIFRTLQIYKKGAVPLETTRAVWQSLSNPKF